MQIQSRVMGILIFMFVILAASCTPTPETCALTANVPVTVYRLPDSASDIFGTMPAGETYEILAQTAEGWLGFDPGVAQAGNVGLARLRWVWTDVIISSSCLDAIDLVTLADVEADF